MWKNTQLENMSNGFDILFHLCIERPNMHSQVTKRALEIVNSPNAAQQLFDLMPKDDPYAFIDYVAEFVSGALVPDNVTAELVRMGEDIVFGIPASPLTLRALENEAGETFEVCKSFQMATEEQIRIFESQK